MYLLGTDEYIERVVTAYSQLLLRIAFTRLHSTAEAEDIVQEAFVKLLSRNSGFRDAEHEKAWLIRVTINLANDVLKSAARSTISLEDTMALPAMPLAAEDSLPLLSAVFSLPVKYSTVIHLYYYEGYAIKEIARILKLPAATVGTRLSRAKRQLRHIIEGEEPQTWIKESTDPHSAR
jgi:RNA polymerase sigma-70 factor (ECF subfamily)